LDISAEKAKERGGYGEERYEKEEMQKKVSQQFERIGEDMRDGQGKWIKVDAGQEKEIVADVIWKEVSTFVGRLENHVGRLWM
jgi:dTMP kinase